MAFLFEDRLAYQKAMAVANDVLRLLRNAPTRNYYLVDQLRRAATSIPANVAEGWGRWHPKEKHHFWRIALGSANECIPYLAFAVDENLIDEASHRRLRAGLEEVCRLLASYIRSLP